MELKCTDTGNADRFKSHYGDTVKHLEEKGRFIVFDEDGWAEADKFILAKEVVIEIHQEAAECKDDSRRIELGKWAITSESAAKQQDMLKLAASYTNVSVDKFDANPTVINCKNGIVNLKTKKFYHHSPEHLHLNKANAEYRPDATCPRWLRFLDEIFAGNQELINWIQIAAGYSIMGLTREHCFFLCYGVGRNGKSTFLETLQYILGNYAHKTNFETFLQNERASSVRAMEAVGDLKGKRFVIASEANDGTRFDAARIKELTGGDTLSGTVLHRPKFTFVPTHTLWFACNTRPQIKDETIAMWSRVKTIPFNVIFIDEDQEAGLSETLRNEADGIFTWLVDGAYLYLKNDELPESPEVCKQATQEYREMNDELSRFIGECLVKEPSAKTLVTAVYDSYLSWHPEYTELIELKKFGNELAKRGISKKRQNTGMVLVGYRLRLPEDVSVASVE